jgi:hypothetical protein
MPDLHQGVKRLAHKADVPPPPTAKFKKECEEYWLSNPFASFLFTFTPVRHRVPSHFNWTLPASVCNYVSILSQKLILPYQVYCFFSSTADFSYRK